MDIKKASEILKEFEPYKTFPLAWLEKDFDGSEKWSAMAIAEAYGFKQAAAHAEILVEALEDISKIDYHGNDKNKCCSCSCSDMKAEQAFSVLKDYKSKMGLSEQSQDGLTEGKRREEERE